jgi:hypothetical protein
LTPPEAGISVNFGAAAKTAAAGRVEAAPALMARKRCLLVTVGGGARSTPTNLVLVAGGTAPAVAVTAAVTMAAVFAVLLLFSFNFYFYHFPLLFSFSFSIQNWYSSTKYFFYFIYQK